MFTIAFIFRRKPELTREQFDLLYEEHRQVMVREARGLVSYVQCRTNGVTSVAGIECNTGLSDFDALSIYTYETSEDAFYTSGLVSVAVDSERFIDFATMITLAVDQHRVV
ncbi:EthD domain-containing protein [Pseudomonas syringae]|uniref:EthD domain-containing protein n=1 Tax=Pseudomonas syringae TaxID=317 RepID=UPI00215B3254|nr:EthD domain-containing protein [Pseudomonas syringae]MCR8717713.1 EthD domain-containing protein [Pseudomonas syringae]